jgi:excinuclease UvrABC nuclease subunit
LRTEGAMRFYDLYNSENIKKLPCVNQSNTNSLPASRAIYFLLKEDNLTSEIYYIGHTQNLRRRMYGHEIVKRINNLFGVRVTIYYWANDKSIMFSLYEQFLIAKLNPVFNIAHSPHHKQRIRPRKKTKRAKRFLEFLTKSHQLINEQTTTKI